jgi:nitroreductase
VKRTSEIIKKVLGVRGIKHLYRKLDRVRMRRISNYDYLKYSKYAFRLVSKKDQVNLRAETTLYYHAIEKGLSNVNFRPGFGKTALQGLFRALDEYFSCGYDANDTRIQTGISVIGAYIAKHEEIGFNVDNIREKYLNYTKHSIHNTAFGGAEEFTRDQIQQVTQAFDFEAFSMSRNSIRDFSPEKVDDAKYIAALEIATTTPSVCNRQSWGVLLVKKGDLMQKLLALQGGMVGFGQNMDSLLLIYTDNRYFAESSERNQGYVDGGLFSMNLLYALHSQGIATCLLNACMSLEREKEVKSLTGLAQSSNIIMFIATGNYPDRFKAPLSKRDKPNEFVRFIH